MLCLCLSKVVEKSSLLLFINGYVACILLETDLWLAWQSHNFISF
uniref:Uncharacterized protein n=1 Tax=Rhizophora mucronata TaxID=61149 RepID=A0A2P2N7L2_RHIMU